MRTFSLLNRRERSIARIQPPASDSCVIHIVFAFVKAAAKRFMQLKHAPWKKLGC